MAIADQLRERNGRGDDRVSCASAVKPRKKANGVAQPFKSPRQVCDRAAKHEGISIRDGKKTSASCLFSQLPSDEKTGRHPVDGVISATRLGAWLIRVRDTHTHTHTTGIESDRGGQRRLVTQRLLSFAPASSLSLRPPTSSID